MSCCLSCLRRHPLHGKKLQNTRISFITLIPITFKLLIILLLYKIIFQLFPHWKYIIFSRFCKLFARLCCVKYEVMTQPLYGVMLLCDQQRVFSLLETSVHIVCTLPSECCTYVEAETHQLKYLPLRQCWTAISICIILCVQFVFT